MTDFDWQHPVYAPIIKQRMARLQRIRAKPEMLPDLKRYYRDHPWQFLSDWGTTSDPRHVEIGLPVTIPFLLFPRQIEWCKWLMERWQAREPGTTVKSRDMGITWLASGMSATLCMFNDEMNIGFGSRKLELVDDLGNPKSIFWKIRAFLDKAPRDFTGGWRFKERLIMFDNGSVIEGEGGDDIGRGGRASLYFVDEAAKVQHQESVDASLSATTNCRQFVGTPNGSDNPFAEKVMYWPEHRVFRFHWRDDPRKDDAWYAKQVDELDSVTLAQEVDMDFSASIEGVIIPQEHVQAMLDAHTALGIEPSGERRAALDVADEGIDNNAWASSHGILLEYIEEWSGKGSHLFNTAVRSFALCDQHELDEEIYDADGMGAFMRGDCEQINQARKDDAHKRNVPARLIRIAPFWGSGAVERPTAKIFPGANRTNEDYFENFKAQCWGTLQYRARETWRARNQPGYQYDPHDIVSISSKIPAKIRTKLMLELSQPTWGPNKVGKMVVNKKPDLPDGRKAKSPNLGDVVMMLFGAVRRRMVISDEAVRRAHGGPR